MTKVNNTAGLGDHSPVEEDPNRLDEQHQIITKVLGFLIHPNIPCTSPTLKIADIGAGSGAWLLDVAKQLPQTCQLIGYDVVPTGFPPELSWPSNMTFKLHDMDKPFPQSELGTFDIVAVRFVSSATTRQEWARSVENLMTLLKPGGWLQWIDSCNFALYNSEPGQSRRACQEIYGAMDSYRDKDDLVIGLMMRDVGNVEREKIWEQAGLVDVHEDVFSTDRIQDPRSGFRDKLTRNVMDCFVSCLRSVAAEKKEDSKWSEEMIDKLKEEAFEEIDRGVYHTLDQVCMVGRKKGRDDMSSE